MPTLILRPMDLIGSAALPLILISIGAGLDVAGLRATATPTIIASLIKVTIAPILAWLCMDLFSLSSTEKMITLIFLGVPTAGTSYVMQMCWAVTRRLRENCSLEHPTQCNHPTLPDCARFINLR